MSFEGDIAYTLQTADHQRRPPGLMLGAQAPAGVPVKVLVEQNQVAELRIVAVLGHVAITGPASVPIRQKKPGQAQGQLIGDLLQVTPVAGAGGKLDFQVVSVWW